VESLDEELDELDELEVLVLLELDETVSGIANLVFEI